MATRTPQLINSMLNAQMKKYLNNGVIVGQQLELGLPIKEISGWNAILLDYVLYSVNIGNADYEAIDKALDYIITN